MNEERLIHELRARAGRDAREFREKFPGDMPNEMWIENSYTAALPLAKDAAHFDPGPGPHPRLFAVYWQEVERTLR